MARVWCDWTADNLLVIPDADFDPAVHRHFDEVAAEKAKGKGKAKSDAAPAADGAAGQQPEVAAEKAKGKG